MGEPYFAATPTSRRSVSRFAGSVRGIPFEFVTDAGVSGEAEIVLRGSGYKVIRATRRTR